MELDITDFFKNGEHCTISASVAEMGDHAGERTWRNACDAEPTYNLLNTDDKREAFRNHVRGFGAWDDDEIATWNDVELGALLLQCIAGDIREAGLDPLNPDWEAYEQGAESGEHSSTLFESDNRIYYTIGY